MRKNGFTLIELIIYAALAGIFLTGVTYFAIGLLNGQAKTLVEQEVNDNLRGAMRRIEFEIRNAQDINTATSSDLCLKMINATYNPTRIYLSSGKVRIAWGGGTTNCTAMANDAQLTSNLVIVNSLTFNNYGNGTTSKNISFRLDISYNSLSGGQQWVKNQNYTTDAELRSN